MPTYFVAIETPNIGCILDTFEIYENAYEYFTKCQDYLNYRDDAIERSFTNRRKYKLNNDPYVNHSLRSMSTGSVSIYLFEIGGHWKSINHFIADREYFPIFPKNVDLRN